MNTINGTEIILITLLIAVNEIDNATSPLANLVITFEVTPPGADAIIITPIAISKGTSIIITNIYAIIGRRTICEKIPIKKIFGLFKTRLKSSEVKPKPNPSIINANAIGAILVTISIKTDYYPVNSMTSEFLITNYANLILDYLFVEEQISLITGVLAQSPHFVTCTMQPSSSFFTSTTL